MSFRHSYVNVRKSTAAKDRHQAAAADREEDGGSELIGASDRARRMRGDANRWLTPNFERRFADLRTPARAGLRQRLRSQFRADAHPGPRQVEHAGLYVGPDEGLATEGRHRN